jgi:hypothetical protein
MVCTSNAPAIGNKFSERLPGKADGPEEGINAWDTTPLQTAFPIPAYASIDSATSTATVDMSVHDSCRLKLPVVAGYRSVMTVIFSVVDKLLRAISFAEQFK